MKQQFNKLFYLPDYYLSSIALAGLAILMIYSGFKGDQIYQDIHKQIAGIDYKENQTICLSFIKIEKFDGTDAVARDRRMNTFYLQIDKSMAIKKGETYSFTGLIMPSGKIKVTEFQIHRYRKEKYIFSSLSFIVVFFLIFKYFRLDKQGIFLIKPRDNKFEDNYNNHS